MPASCAAVTSHTDPPRPSLLRIAAATCGVRAQTSTPRDAASASVMVSVASGGFAAPLHPRPCRRR